MLSAGSSACSSNRRKPKRKSSRRDRTQLQQAGSPMVNALQKLAESQRWHGAARCHSRLLKGGSIALASTLARQRRPEASQVGVDLLQRTRLTRGGLGRVHAGEQALLGFTNDLARVHQGVGSRDQCS